MRIGRGFAVIYFCAVLTYFRNSLNTPRVLARGPKEADMARYNFAGVVLIMQMTSKLLLRAYSWSGRGLGTSCQYE